MHNHIPTRIHRRQLPAQLADLAQQANGAVGELGKEGRVDAGGGFCGHDGVVGDVVVGVPGSDSMIWEESALKRGSRW